MGENVTRENICLGRSSSGKSDEFRDHINHSRVFIGRNLRPDITTILRLTGKVVEGKTLKAYMFRIRVEL